jgi:two-component system phosphate regulon sensor histidine kinase PhoR
LKLGLRSKLFVISLLLIGGVGTITLVFFASQLRDDLAASIETDLHAFLLLGVLVGMGAAVILSGVASELMARTLRAMVDEAVEAATGQAPSSAEDSGDELVPVNSRSFRAIADDLRDAVGDLAEERDRLETILEQMHDAVLVVDAEGRVSLTNDAANHLLMMDDDDVGRPLLEAVRAPVLSDIVAQVAQVEGGRNVTAEFDMDRPKHRQVMAHAASIRNDGGVVIVMHDITEVRRLERVRRDFVANVSHELRTPISVIRANAETLLDGALEDSERAGGFVEGIHRSSERLSLLIADLLDLSRIEAGHYATDIKSVTVRDAVDAVVDGLVSEARRSVEVVNEVDDGASVLADTTGLSQILQNLLDNAIKYAPEDGHVWVRAMPSNDVVRIEVQDDGPGIEPHHRRRVFERFYRIDPGRSRQLGGTGLGLSIVKHLAEGMGGSVGVEAAPERGSLFWVELPRAS